MDCHDVDPPASAVRRASYSPRRWRAVRVLVVAVVLVALGAIAIGSVAGSEGGNASSATDAELVVSDATVDPTATETHRLALTDAPEGLAGFEVTLALESGDVATVTNASYPDHFGLTTDPAVSADGRTVTVEAADLGDEITSGATDVTLAEIDVTGVEPGETELQVTELQIDADGGSAIEPSLEAGTVTVGDGAVGSSSQNDDGTETGPESEADSDSVPGFAGGVTIAALAAVATVLLVRRA
ncbi:hypothetical protein [Natronorubrum halophilum]|uniref:hypothetical protein n=1 Tax=Natronorubrum halophilum TaxID=1702106 RepID=UPI0010C15E80|nr:hypothetical protein [Natronorubrum halophilum]